jgi:hypothetical protein
MRSIRAGANNAAKSPPGQTADTRGNAGINVTGQAARDERKVIKIGVRLNGCNNLAYSQNGEINPELSYTLSFRD